ncbi:MAG: glutathione S-transferase family protein [Pikeienuella sp.]
MKLHLFPFSPNARKCLFVNAHLNLGAEIVVVDLPGGANKSEAFTALNPNQKIPVLEMDDGETLWESNAIVNCLAGMVDTPLWPKTNQRYDIGRWQFWEAAHLNPGCRPFAAKHIFKTEGIDTDAATPEFRKYLSVLDGHLEGRNWLSGDNMTTADVSVSAIFCLRHACHFPMEGFDNVARWLAAIEATDAWKAANS